MPSTSPGAGTSTKVTPLELFFDLVVVFAITQVTSLNGRSRMFR
jgi:low temperature requirement protein LtrA